MDSLIILFFQLILDKIRDKLVLYYIDKTLIYISALKS